MVSSQPTDSMGDRSLMVNALLCARGAFRLYNDFHYLHDLQFIKFAKLLKHRNLHSSESKMQSKIYATP